MRLINNDIFQIKDADSITLEEALKLLRYPLSLVYSCILELPVLYISDLLKLIYYVIHLGKPP